MASLAAKRGFTSGILAAILLSSLVITRLVFCADSASVYFFGHQVKNVCSIREQFGSPCPGCGLTRSVILTLQGDFRLACQINPAGFLGVLGFTLFSMVMLYLSCYQQKHCLLDVEKLQRFIRFGSVAYGILLVFVLFGHWLLILEIPAFSRI